jgi:hypothetical protein
MCGFLRNEIEHSYWSIYGINRHLVKKSVIEFFLSGIILLVKKRWSNLKKGYVRSRAFSIYLETCKVGFQNSLCFLGLLEVNTNIVQFCHHTQSWGAISGLYTILPHHGFYKDNKADNIVTLRTIRLLNCLIFSLLIIPISKKLIEKLKLR